MSAASTFGALLLGGLAAICLSGLLGAQTYIYFKLYPTDLRRIQYVVAVIWLVDLFHSLFICAGLWRYFITEYGNFSAHDQCPWTISSTILCTAIITILVQCFFAYRIYLFTKCNWYYLAFILFLNVLRFGAAVASATELLRLGSFSSFRLHAGWVATLGLSLSSGVDLIVTFSLCYYLRKSSLQVTSLKPVMDSLFIYTFEGGSLTCLSTFVTVICWVSMPQNIIFMGFHFLIAKLFGNTLLVTLNTRQQLRSIRGDVISGLPMTSIDFEFRKRTPRLTEANTEFTLTCDAPAQPLSRPHSIKSVEVTIPS